MGDAMRHEGPRHEMFLPSTSLLVKLGSIAVHTQEFMSADGHPYDMAALEGLLADQEVIAWLKLMDAAAFLPKKRRP